MVAENRIAGVCAEATKQLTVKEEKKEGVQNTTPLLRSRGKWNRFGRGLGDEGSELPVISREKEKGKGGQISRNNVRRTVRRKPSQKEQHHD